MLLRTLVPISCGNNDRCNNAVRFKTRISLKQGDKASEQLPANHDQRHSQSDFHTHECAAKPIAPACATTLNAKVLSRNRARPTGSECRRYPEYNTVD